MGGFSQPGAPIEYAYLGIGVHNGLTAEVDVSVMETINEIKGWPPVVFAGSNLAATGASPLSLWWRDDAAGVAITLINCTSEGLPTTYGDWALKCVASGATNGPSQLWTYADEPRLKAARTMSGLCAVYVPAGRTVTARLTDSVGATDVTATSSTTAAWERLALEGKVLAGTTATFKVLPDAACTFYVILLGAHIGAKAFPLPPRGLRYVEPTSDVTLVNAIDPGGAGFTDVDCTASTSALAAMVNLLCQYVNNTNANKSMYVRRNGSSLDVSALSLINPTAGGYTRASRIVALDDGQVFEYKTNAVAGDNEAVTIYLTGYWEWA